MKRGGACGGALNAEGAIVEVVSGLLAEVEVEMTGFRSNGRTCFTIAESLAAKRRGKARMRAAPKKRKMARKRKRSLDGRKAASLL